MKLTSAYLAVPLLASTTHAIFGGKAPAKPQPNLVDGFVWADPFETDAISSFDVTCETEKRFEALEYTLHDLMEPPPKGLFTWASGLKTFFAGREYPGGWSGYDRHLHDRAILRMDYDKVPLELRKWIEEEDRTGGKGKGLFAVFEKPKLEGDTFDAVVKFPAASEVDRAQDQEKVAIFAPGAIYHVLPLWAAEESRCKDELLDLTNYKPKPKDGAVVAWADHKKPVEQKTEVLIRVKALKNKEVPVASETGENGAKAEL